MDSWMMDFTIEASVTWVSLAFAEKAQSNASMATKPVPVFFMAIP